MLPECTLYVTVEPCVMCGVPLGGAEKRVVWGASEPKSGFTAVSRAILHPKTEVTEGVLAEECATLMKPSS